MSPTPGVPWALVLEDDPAVAVVLERCLARLGWPLIATADWARARALLADEDCRLLVADQGLADDFTGSAAIDWSRAHHPSVRCVLVSGATRPPRFRDEPPHQVFLDKPFGPDDLRSALARLELSCGAPIARIPQSR